MALDNDHRKLIVGCHNGKIKVFDLLSGVKINDLEEHGGNSEDVSGEISFIGYGNEDGTIITTAWDRTIKIHDDDRDETKKISDNVLRARCDCHKKDIICGDYSHNLGLIATGGRDNLVRLWDYERMKEADNGIRAHKDEVTIVKFLKPFPLLMTSDSKGVMYIWLLPPWGGDNIKCLVKWCNKHSMEQDIPISAVDVFYEKEGQQFLLLIADEKGDVKIQDISIILKKYKLEEVDITLTNLNYTGKKRLPLERQIDMDTNEETEAMLANRPEQEGELPQGEIKQLYSWTAHKDVIRAIHYIDMTDEPLVFTASYDRMAYIWDLNKNCRGKLIQGYMLKKNYEWDFPLSKY